MTQQTPLRRGPFCFFLLLCISLLLALALAGCGQTSQAQTGLANESPTAATSQAEPTATSPAGATPTAVSSQAPVTPTPASTSSTPALHGPTNFVMDLPFHFVSVNGVNSDDSGNTTALDETTVKNSVTEELHHLLFVVDSSNAIKVYSQGQSPQSVQLHYNADGSASISYTQTADSEAGTISIFFSGVITGKQIYVQYEQQYSPSLMINAAASDIVVEFSAPVKWVTSQQIPAAPSNGTHQATSVGGVALSWTAGQNAAGYDVYRLISDQDQQFQFLATAKGTSYTDNSAAVLQNLHDAKGITYAIFSVGPTGVENPGGIIISI